MVNTRPALSRASLSALHWERHPTRTHPSTLRLCHEARRHSASATPDQTLFGLCRLSGRPRAERSAIKQNLCVHTTIAGIVKGKCHLNFIDIVRVIDFVFLVLGWLVQQKTGKNNVRNSTLDAPSLHTVIHEYSLLVALKRAPERYHKMQ